MEILNAILKDKHFEMSRVVPRNTLGLMRCVSQSNWPIWKRKICVFLEMKPKLGNIKMYCEKYCVHKMRFFLV